MGRSNENPSTNRQHITLRTDLATRLSAISAYATAKGVNPHTIEGFVDHAVEVYLRDFDKQLLEF